MTTAAKSATPPDTTLARPHTAVLFIHGFTGSPQALEPLAARIHERACVPVSVPRLQGHGTRWQDMLHCTWADWCADVRQAADSLLTDPDTRLVVVGLSMGGALATWLAEVEPRVCHTVLINPALVLDTPGAALLPLLSKVVRSIPAIGGDIAKPGADEGAYSRTPLAPLASFQAGQAQVRAHLGDITGDVTLCKSTTDHVVGPASAGILRHALGKRLRMVVLRHSYHVATLDYDAGIIADEVERAVLGARGGGAS